MLILSAQEGAGLPKGGAPPAGSGVSAVWPGFRPLGRTFAAKSFIPARANVAESHAAPVVNA